MASKQTTEMEYPMYCANHEAGVSILVTNPRQRAALGKGWVPHEPVDPELLSTAEWPRHAMMRMGGAVVTILSAEQYAELREQVELIARPEPPPKSKNHRHCELQHQRHLAYSNRTAKDQAPGPVPGLARIVHPLGMECEILPEQERYFGTEWEGLPLRPLPDISGGWFTLDWSAKQAAEVERAKAQAEIERRAKVEREQIEREQAVQALERKLAEQGA